MKKFDNLTVRELLHIEDGYYKLESPIAYSIGVDSSSTTGEISGVISLDTKTNSTDGILKVITTMSDDVSYYVDNIWQDGDTLIVAEKDEGSSGGGESGGGSSEIVLKATETLPCPCECEYTPDQFRDAFQENSADGKMPSFKLVFFTSTTERDSNLTTTLWSNYVKFTEGMGGKAVEVSFTDINGSIYQVRGPYGRHASDPGLWFARKVE